MSSSMTGLQFSSSSPLHLLLCSTFLSVLLLLSVASLSSSFPLPSCFCLLVVVHYSSCSLLILSSISPSLTLLPLISYLAVWLFVATSFSFTSLSLRPPSFLSCFSRPLVRWRRWGSVLQLLFSLLLSSLLPLSVCGIGVMQKDVECVIAVSCLHTLLQHVMQNYLQPCETPLSLALPSFLTVRLPQVYTNVSYFALFRHFSSLYLLFLMFRFVSSPHLFIYHHQVWHPPWWQVLHWTWTNKLKSN